MVNLETITFISLLTELKEKSILGFKPLSECDRNNSKLYLFYDDNQPKVFSCDDYTEDITVSKALTKSHYALSYPLIKRVKTDLYEGKWEELENNGKVNKEKDIVFYKDIFKVIPDANDYIVNVVEKYDNGIITWDFEIKDKNDPTWYIRLGSTGWQIDLIVPENTEGVNLKYIPLGHKFYDIKGLKELQAEYEVKENLRYS